MNDPAPVPSLGVPTGSALGFQSLGPITGHRRVKERWLIECGAAQVRVMPLPGGIIRVQLSPNGMFGRDHSWAVLPNSSPPTPWKIDDDGVDLELMADGVRVRASRNPCRITFLDSRGAVICADDPHKGMAWAGEEVACWKSLHEADHFFGLGEKGCPLDKRNTATVNWNTDAAEHEPWSDPLYQTHPFVISLNKGRAYGIFFDNTHRSVFDLGKTSRASWSFGADGGELNYYFIPGPTPSDVVRAYARLVGTPHLPPLWSLGYQQCRWSYESAKRAIRIAKDFRKRDIPCDTIYLDIDHMDGFRSFTWHPKRFPRPDAMLKNLSRKGFKLVVIIDPGLKAEPGHWVYDSGIAGRHFLFNDAGTVHVGNVWPGESVFPDFTRAATRQWWGQLYRDMLSAGVSGIWNDMNEPADLKRDDKTLPLTVRFDNDGEPSDHRECHNIYGMQTARATFEGLARLRENVRPFVLTRAGYSGVQRYAAVWTGDNLSSWEHLRMSISMLLNMSLSGVVFCGADIGGFRGRASAELFTRWLQLGIFYPLCRVHTAGGPEQDPWSFGKRHEKANRRTIELRYRLLPYLYSEFHHAAQTGLPILRPLLLDFPEMPNVHRREHEFLFGRQLFVAPVVHEGATVRKVELPPGDWYDFDDAAPRAGSAEIEIPVDSGTIPMFACGGAIIPTRDVVQYIDDEPLDCLTLNIYPGRGGGSFYNDDGRTYDYQRGEFTWESYDVHKEANITTLRLAERRGTDGFTPGRYLLRFLGIGMPPAAVAAAGEPLSQCKNRKAFEKGRSGWWYDREARTVWVHLPRLAVGDCVEILHKVGSLSASPACRVQASP
jgi:alpha-glucosidase